MKKEWACKKISYFLKTIGANQKIIIIAKCNLV